MNDERDRDPVWVQGNALCDRLLQVVADADPNREVAAAGTSMLVAQVLAAMAYADKQVALTMFQEVFVPYIEYFVKAVTLKTKPTCGLRIRGHAGFTRRQCCIGRVDGANGRQIGLGQVIPSQA
jgi:hypothetical protein